MVTAPTAPGLVVPIDLVAFCVSQSDAVNGTSSTSFSGATVDYAALTDTNPNAYLGASAARAFGDPPLNPLEAGVHLHWALPDALTKGTVDGDAPIAFPTVPNRWLVTRFAISGATAVATSFVVESDTLSATPPGHVAPLIPVRQDGTSAPAFAYLGGRAPLDGYAARLGATAFKDATAGNFTAVANGLPSFAAYYPEGRASFGFVDTLADLGAAASLMYIVTGWFEDAAHDPATLVRSRTVKLAKGARPATLAETHRWGGAEDPPAYTLYSGTVQSVAWNPDGAYVPAPANQPVIDADAAIANTPSEALAAYFRAVLHPTMPFFEQILTAFQQGQWNNFSQPTPDMLAAIAESLHDSQFQRVESGSILTIYQKGSDGSAREAIDLPQGIADALNTANAARADTLTIGNHVATFQWQVFADWFRYFNTGDPTQQSVVFNHFTQVLMPIWTGANADGLQVAWNLAQGASTAAETALTTVLAQRPDLSLREVPGPRYWQPTDPALLLTGPDLALSPRYGGDNEHSGSGLLECRTTDQLVTGVTIGGITKTASDFSTITQLTSNALPYLAACEALLAEACLLDTAIAGSWSGVAPATLQSALQALLTGGTQSHWTVAAGQAPSPVEVNWWDGANPWLPLFLEWTAQFVPLQPTIANTTLEDYDPAFFTANYTIDSETGSFLAYTPGGPHGIVLDPAKTSFTNTYQGQAILSDKAADNLAKTITAWLAKNSDPTLQSILDDLQSANFVVQPLSGFTESLVNRLLQTQFALVSPDDASPMAQIVTQAAAGVIGTAVEVGTTLTSAYNPIRAGYLKIQANAIDAFGQKRAVRIGNLAISESMTTLIKGAAEPGIAYAAPRIAQPSRLLFQWMSAGDNSVAEINAHPASSPICGWLMPNHLTGGFFLYDDTGAPLGSLQLNGATPAVVVWQGAPGDDATIDQPIAQALADANPLLRDLALALFAATPDFFRAFYSAVDTTHATINPQSLALESGLGVIAGRPTALVQAALRLDLQGRPYLNQNAACLTDTDWTDTENGLSGVQFPVLLGDADRLDDGLVGFFLGLDGGSGFDLATFFSSGADPAASTGVVVPDAGTLQLTLTPTLADPDPPPVTAETTRVLMLVDPRAPVHAVTGILPTQTLAVPSDLASAALSSLEISFLAAPVLKPSAVLSMPVPAAGGFDISFIEQVKAPGTGKPEWVTFADIAATSPGAAWSYTPQSLTEGWLRANQTQLSFEITNGAGKAIVIAGQTQDVTLTLTNRKPNAVTFTPGVLAPEGTAPDGSVFYIHFGALVADADVASIGLSASGWTFAAQSDAVYGPYWAATPAADAVTLVPSATLTIAVTGLMAATGLAQAKLFFDYYAVDGAADGVFTDTVVTGPAS